MGAVTVMRVQFVLDESSWWVCVKCVFVLLGAVWEVIRVSG